VNYLLADAAHFVIYTEWFGKFISTNTRLSVTAISLSFFRKLAYKRGE